jgi:hypothetical protein
MKTTPIVSFKINADGKVETTCTLLQQCLKIPPQSGFDFATMRSRLRVEAAIEKLAPEDQELKLEDADHAAAVEAIKGTRWAVNEKHIIQFAEQFGL